MFHCVGMIKLLVMESISGPSSCPRGQGWGQRFHPVNLMAASSNHQPLSRSEGSVTPEVLDFPRKKTQESGISHENYLKQTKNYLKHQQGLNSS